MEPLILEITTNGLHQYFPIDKEVTLVGRALDNDIILSEATVAAHHLKIIRHLDGSVELLNIAKVNPSKIDRRVIDTLVTHNLPVELQLGRIQAQLLNRNHAVEDTRALPVNARHGGLFAHAIWSILLVLACLIAGSFDYYLYSYVDFKWSDLIKYLLRETIFSMGVVVLAFLALERLLVNRWEIKQVVTLVSLVYLTYYFLTLLVEFAQFSFSATWPGTAFHFAWYLFFIPSVIAFYLIQISHLKRSKGLLLAAFIASPISLPTILHGPQLHDLLNNFTNAAVYQNSLSSFNLHLKSTQSIGDFIADAQKLKQGESAN